MKVSHLEKIRETIDMPQYLKMMIQILNRFMSDVHTILNRRVNIDNLEMEIKEFILSDSDLPFTFAVNITNPKACDLLQIVEIAGNHVILTNAIFIDWIFSNGNIIIYNIVGITAGKRYNIRVRVM